MMKPPNVGLRQRLGKHQVGQRIRLAAAKFGLVHQTEKPGLAHAPQHVARHAAVFFPLGGKGLNLAGNKTCDLLAQQFVFRGDEDVVHS